MADRGLTIERMVRLAQVNRASYYRFDEESVGSGADSEMELRDAIQRIALEWPSYGRAAVTGILRYFLT
jgi:putative transposase